MVAVLHKMMGRRRNPGAAETARGTTPERKVPMRSQPTKVSRTCQRCGKAFFAWPYKIREGKARFCSKACGYAHPRPQRPRKRTLPADRFWKYVEKTEGCWLWTAARGGGGYGQLGVGRMGENRFVRAHRLSYEIHVGAIPDGMCVLHHCDNPQCVRPDHLFLGTPRDNSEDMIRKGRHSYGEKRPLSVLTADQVREMRCLFAAGGVTKMALARRFKINHATVRAILARKAWKHVE